MFVFQYSADGHLLVVQVMKVKTRYRPLFREFQPTVLTFAAQSNYHFGFRFFSPCPINHPPACPVMLRVLPIPPQPSFNSQLTFSLDAIRLAVLTKQGVTTRVGNEKLYGWLLSSASQTT
jgi:hypothetical protein